MMDRVQAPAPDQARWHAAAQALVEGCIDLRSDDERVALLSAVCEGLGDELYPAFLRVLWLIGQYGDHAAREAVARALVHALRTGRLPSGRRNAWGAADASPSGGSYGRMRTLGPLEYLCVWHAQAEAPMALSADEFDTAARALLDVVATSREARLLYCEKLLADVEDPLSGAMARRTREAIRALALAWADDVPAADAIRRFLDVLAAAQPRSLALMAGAGVPATR